MHPVFGTGAVLTAINRCSSSTVLIPLRQKQNSRGLEIRTPTLPRRIRQSEQSRRGKQAGRRRFIDPVPEQHVPDDRLWPSRFLAMTRLPTADFEAPATMSQALYECA
jgi:hypothetical protein